MLSSFFFLSVEFGPMIRTTHADKMKEEISKLKASGGGDDPEMCLSGLQVLQSVVTFSLVTGILVNQTKTFQKDENVDASKILCILYFSSLL